MKSPVPPDIFKCDLCGSEDGERRLMMWHGTPVWVDAACEPDCEPV